VHVVCISCGAVAVLETACCCVATWSGRSVRGNPLTDSGEPRRENEAPRDPYLTVTDASASHRLAMTLRSGREKDRQDVVLLCKHLESRGRDEAI